MIWGLDNHRGLKKCLLGSAVLAFVSLLLTLYSGTSVHLVPKPMAKIVGTFRDLTGSANVRPAASDTNRSHHPNHPQSMKEIMDRRFESRQELIHEICQHPDYEAMRRNVSRRYFGVARGRIKWCRIPKVGTTYLSFLEKNILKASLPKKDGKDWDPPTLMFVREPYSRLVSGYIGKIVTNQPWWRSYGTSIVKRFRPRATPLAKQCGNDVTFPEFIKYFIATQVDKFRPNPHWTPLHKMCNPCGTPYDFIGHLETYKDDLTFVLNSVNVSMDMDFSDEEQTMRSKAQAIVRQKKNIVKCESMCSALRTVWWSFQARGLISTDIVFPVPAAQCDFINGTEFADLAWDAHLQSVGNINKHKQRREMMVKLYLQVALADRMKVRDLLIKDFELYGYDSQPPDLFPELMDYLG